MDINKQLEGLSELIKLVAIYNFKKGDDAFDYLVSASAYLNIAMRKSDPADIDGYNKGYADGSLSVTKEILSRNDLYQQGRADAIDELEKIVSKIFEIQNNGKSKFRPSIVITKSMIEDIMEQLKEQKNE